MSYIKVGFKSWLDDSKYNIKNELTTNWVKGVATSGTFVCPKELPIEYGVSRIPEGWTVETY